ncbi:hypothetical protein SP5_034_01090 [Sphingomonas parapaucimobilis NBRC 15100]|uniref:Uncharacterized protein n=2 Tax=Sphingomonas parapaucimobilis TaxID=28213 RepID=A0A0A1W520_9SPHN|nr:hypothetical protein SP5_034_01090 [Sphingomonas parapaucimobilis NBRC 15100]
MPGRGTMTLPRDPMSFEFALQAIEKRIGSDAVRQIASRAQRTIDDWRHPETPRTPPIETALALDRAWRAAGGAGAPMLDTYRRLFETSAPIVVGIDDGDLPDLTVIAIRESADAHAALLIAMQPQASERDRRAAVREIAEGISAFEATLPHLIGQLPP